MRAFVFYMTFIFCSILSCGNPSEGDENVEDDQNTTTLYGDKNFVFPILSENAKTFTMHWGAYEDFEDEAKNINGSTVEALRDKTERLILRIDSLTKKVPDTLKTNPIVSRLMVSKTRASLLHQEVRKVHIDTAKLQIQIHEMNLATSNLIMQIDEKFKKDAIDFQQKDEEKKELEKQQKFIDSVYRAELKDNKSE